MRVIQFREALREAMIEEMIKDDTIYLIGEEVGEYEGAYKVSQGMLKKFGSKRIIDTPISESGFSGISIGSAMNGLKPIVEFMTFNFSLVAIDSIINSAAKIFQMSGGQFSIPIVFRGPTGSAGQLGAQHSQCFANWYANCPGLKVIVCSNPYDAKGLLKSSIIDPDPVIFMESETMYSDKAYVPEKEYYIDIGKAKIVKNGTDITIVGFGKILKNVYEAITLTKDLNINVEVIDLRTIRPIDYNTVIQSVKKTGRLILIEESWPLGNISTEIAFMIQKEAFDYIDHPIIRLNSPDVPMPYSNNLVKRYLPSTNDVIKAFKKVMYLS
ncbi:MAG: pyruvate dehydrogenase complex E1 component subunit beta [Bacteroides sp.]|nr:MAG: pyruvate dehydrogenase complex E1 component subunit beta [Bacteroides sp.]